MKALKPTIFALILTMVISSTAMAGNIGGTRIAGNIGGARAAGNIGGARSAGTIGGPRTMFSSPVDLTTRASRLDVETAILGSLRNLLGLLLESSALF
jgi:hypothetical protein